MTAQTRAELLELAEALEAESPSTINAMRLRATAATLRTIVRREGVAAANQCDVGNDIPGGGAC